MTDEEIIAKGLAQMKKVPTSGNPPHFLLPLFEDLGVYLLKFKKKRFREVSIDHHVLLDETRWEFDSFCQKPVGETQEVSII